MVRKEASMISRNDKFYAEFEMTDDRVFIYVEQNGESIMLELKDNKILINNKEYKDERLQ